jgi:hypothetical protein
VWFGVQQIGDVVGVVDRLERLLVRPGPHPGGHVVDLRPVPES